MKPALPPVAPSMRLSTVLLLAGLIALIAASFVSLPLKWRDFFTIEAMKTIGEFLRGFAPPEMAPAFLRKVGIATVETLSMSALGTLIAALFGLALALPAGGRFGSLARAVTRMVLNVLRSIPELVWASLLLIAAGLGPFGGAGTGCAYHGRVGAPVRRCAGKHLSAAGIDLAHQRRAAACGILLCHPAASGAANAVL